MDLTVKELINPSTGEIISGAEVSRTSLSLPINITQNDWLEVGRQLNEIETGIGWWRGDWWLAKNPEWGSHVDEAEEAGVSYTTAAHCAKVCEEINSCRRRQNLSFSHHIEVCGLHEEAQDEALDWAEQNSASMRDLRKHVRTIKARLNHGDPQDPGMLPEGKYRVIYADPPWSYESASLKSHGVSDDHYGNMSTEQLCELPIADMRGDDSVLFLWAVAPLLPDALEVIEAWGFEYKAQFIWDKVKHNMGHYNSVRHELLLICTHGSCLPDERVLIDSVVSIERTGHSQKPEEFREIIDKLYPYGRRVELFSRSAPDHWTVWGNQSGSDAQLSVMCG